jgi:hypothetical protein
MQIVSRIVCVNACFQAEKQGNRLVSSEQFGPGRVCVLGLEETCMSFKRSYE